MQKPIYEGVHMLICCLPIQSPWLNPIGPKWAHAKRRVVEPDGTLTAQELADRFVMLSTAITEVLDPFPFPKTSFGYGLDVPS